MKTRRSSRFASLALSAVLAAQVVPAQALAASEAREASSNFGIGVVTVLANLVYMPVKTTFGLLGAFTGSLAYVLTGGNREVADGVWVPSLGGDYVLSTDMMTGRESVHFSGVRPGPTANQDPNDESMF
jgi:hypothetical protein